MGDDPEELVATLAEAERLVALLEETVGLSVTIADVQGVRGPRGAPGAVGPAGPKGDPGPASTGTALSKRALGPLSAGSVVRLHGDAYVTPVNAMTRGDALAPMAVVQYAVSAPEQTVSVIVYGEHEDDTWSFAPGGAVFVGPTGLLTQSVGPEWAFVRVVGFAVTASKVFIDPQPPVLQVVGG